MFWVPMNIQKDWKAKLESAYSFMLKCSKIAVVWFDHDKNVFDEKIFLMSTTLIMQKNTNKDM